MERKRMGYLNSRRLDGAREGIDFNTASSYLTQCAAELGIGFIVGSHAPGIAALYDEECSGSVAKLEGGR